jgi:hypothetical protein
VPGRRLERVRHAQQRPVRPAAANQLQPHRQAARGEPGRHGDGGQPGDRDQVTGPHPVQVRGLRLAVDLVHPVQRDVERHDLRDRAGEHLDVREELADPLRQGRVPQGRPAQVGHAQLEPALDVPDHVRSQFPWVRAQQRAEVGDEPKGAPGSEHLVRPGEVRRGVDHLTAQVCQHLPGRGQDRAHGRFHRQAEIGTPGHPDAGQVSPEQARDLAGLDPGRLGVESQRHPRVRAGQGHQQQRDVGHRAGHGSLDGEHVGDVRDGPDRHPPGRWPQADRIAEAGRVAKRPAQVAAVGQADHPRGERRRRAPAAAARAPAEVVGVPGGAEHGIDGVRPRAELGRVRLAQADRPGRGHPLHDERVAVGNMLSKQR